MPRVDYADRDAVITQDVDTRAVFIGRTYGHLAGAIAAFTAIEVYFFTSGLAEDIATAMFGLPWMLILGAFLVVGWIASHVAHQSVSKGAQYLALCVYIIAEATIFVPLLYIADVYAPGAIQSAALVTLLGFAGLTAIAFVTRKDFSFLKGILMFGFVLALAAIVGGAIFGFQLGLWFSVAMIALAGGAILYDTSNILLRYNEDRYIAAALQLFASVALMFWYVLRLLIALQRR